MRNVAPAYGFDVEVVAGRPPHRDLRATSLGGEVVDIVDGSVQVISVPDEELYNGGSWSPEGEKLIYEIFEPDAFAVVDVESGDATQVRPASATMEWSLRDPVWSPGGTRIAFIAGPAF